MTSSSDIPTAGWYADPTRRHTHRYWDGTRWTHHVATGSSSFTDPIEASAARIPPAPATGAPLAPPPTQRVVVTTRSGGSIEGILIGVLLAIVVLVVAVIIYASSDSSEPSTTEPVTTEPVTTEPVTTEPVTTEPPETEPPATGAP